MVLICGIPNAGKTTYANTHYTNVLHLDDMRGPTRRERVAEAVRKDNGLVVEGVYSRAEDRKLLVQASDAHNTCIWLNTPLQTCIEREARGRKRSAFIVQWPFKNWQEPTYDEGWDEIIVIRG